MQQKNFLKEIINFSKGFTLVETLIALSIFSLGVTALMAVLGDGLMGSSYAKEKFTAEYLAQEGIEIFRNKRDNYILFDAGGAQAGWNNFKNEIFGPNALCDNSNGCYLDDAKVFLACNPDCPMMLYDVNYGKYNYTTGNDSLFIRKLFAQNISADELVISSTILWQRNSNWQSISFSEHLFNWVE